VSNNDKQTHSRSSKALGVALGAMVSAGLLTAHAGFAAENPFGMKALTKGYMVADAEGKCGEGKCGGDKKAGAATTDDGQAAAPAAGDEKATEAKCGEGKCGADKKATEAKCGADKKAHEAKCGEGKCGDKKAPEVTCGADKKGHEGSMADPTTATV